MKTPMAVVLSSLMLFLSSFPCEVRAQQCEVDSSNQLTVTGVATFAGQIFQNFGSSVSAQDDRAAIGYMGDSVTIFSHPESGFDETYSRAGRVYLYETDLIDWEIEESFVHPELVLISSFNIAEPQDGLHFGVDVDFDVSETRFIAGVSGITGKGFFGQDDPIIRLKLTPVVHEYENGAWTQFVLPLPPNYPPLRDGFYSAQGYGFGSVVAISGDYVAVGEPRWDTTPLYNGVARGRVHIYSRNTSGEWDWTQTIDNPSGFPNIQEFFGQSLSISDGLLAIGSVNSRQIDSNGIAVAAGSVFLYELNNGTWVQAREFVSSDPQVNQWFGDAIDLNVLPNGDIELAIGAPQENTFDPTQGTGSVFVYRGSSVSTMILTDHLTDLFAGNDQGGGFGSSVNIQGDLMSITRSRRPWRFTSSGGVIPPPVLTADAYIASRLDVSGTWAIGASFLDSVQTQSDLLLGFDAAVSGNGVLVTDPSSVGLSGISNGVVYVFDIPNTSENDCNSDGFDDQCQIFFSNGLLDLNDNGILDVCECVLPGDVNGDGSVDLADLNLVLANFGQTTSVGDANGDGVVDLADLNLVLANFGASCTEQGEAMSSSFSMSMTDSQELPVTIWLMLKDHPNAEAWIDQLSQFEPTDQKQDAEALKEWVDEWESETP